MSEGYEAGHCYCTKATDKAILCHIQGVGKHWIPKSQIHDNSEVYDVHHEGELVVKLWFAEKQGWL